MLNPARYELLEPLGEGAFGSVRRGVHHPTGLPVAVKLLRRAEPDAVRMLLDEAGALAKVQHPNVARLYDVGRTEDGLGFLVMELVRGHDFELWLGAWPGWPVVGQALLETLDGLAAAHSVGVVHRDLKPANLLLDERDGRLRLVDFGIARVVDPLESDEERPIAGTPEFMAPEQLGGFGAVGPATDLYAFGVLLHHVLRDASPYDDDLPLPVLLAAKLTRVALGPQPARQGLEVPRQLDALIDALLSPEPHARPRFAAEVRRTLEGLLPQVVEQGQVEARSAHRRSYPSVGPTLVRPNARPSVLPGDEPTDPRQRPLQLELPAPADPRRAPSLVPLRDTALVGREAEQAYVMALVDSVLARRTPHVLFVLGEPGVGKSRLARWAVQEVERRGALVSAAARWELDGAGVGGGLRHILARLVGIPEPRERAPFGWLLARDRAIDADLLRAILVPRPEGKVPTRAETLALTRRVLAAVARDAPLLLWLDDVGWSRDGAAELLESVLSEGTLPVLFVATMRTSTLAHPEVAARLSAVGQHSATRALTLAPLDASGRTRLVEEVAPLAPEVARELALRVEGTPVVLVQLVHDWIESKRLVPGPNGLVPGPEHTVGSLLAEWPATRSLDARIERFLGSFGRMVADAEGILLRAALLGGAFEVESLLPTCGNKGLAAAVPEVVDRAILAGVLRAEGGRLSVEHGLVRDNLLSRLDARADRRGILLDTANGIQARFGKDRADVAFAVARLLRRADQADAAWERLMHAVGRAAWTGDVPAARAMLEEMLAWQREDVAANRRDPVARIELAQARIEYMANDFAPAQRHLAAARAAYQPADGEALWFQIASLEADVAFYDERYADAERIASEVLVAARETVDPGVALEGARAAFRLSDVALLRGDLEAAHGFRLESADHARASGSAERMRLSPLSLAELGIARHQYAQARQWIAETLEEASRAGDSDHVYLAREVQSFIDLCEGSTAPRVFLEERLATANTLGERWRSTAMSIALALAAAIDRGDEAVRSATQAMLVAFDRMPHDGPMETHALRLLEARLRQRGLVVEADAIVHRLDVREELVRRSLSA